MSEGSGYHGVNFSLTSGASWRSGRGEGRGLRCGGRRVTAGSGPAAQTEFSSVH